MQSNSSPKFKRVKTTPIALVALVLAGCTVTEQSLAPIPGDISPQSSPQTGTQTSVQPGTGDLGATTGPFSQTTATPATASLAQKTGSIRFTPVIGAPLNAVTPLSRQLALEAQGRGLTILSAADPGGESVLKGYFTAFNDETKTTIIYVWDVLDAAGNRLHRIQGQEEVPGTSPDPWSLVPAATMEKIATRTMDEYSLWRQGARG